MSGRRAERLGWVAMALLLVGCAYYNGLYNANRLANDAARAERQGKPGEAHSLWTQAAVKAESVVVRFPRSKWRDDALLLWGRALRGGGGCSRAVDPLQLAADSSLDGKIADQALLLLGQCRVELGQPDLAVAALTPLIAGVDSKRAREPLLWRGRAYLQLGDHAAAARDLERVTEPSPDFDLATAYAGLDRVDAAVAVLRKRLSDRRYDEPAWQEALDSLGARHPTAASGLVDGLLGRADLTAGQRAGLLRADGHRWLTVADRERAEARFRGAVDAAPDSVAGLAALGEVALLTTRSTSDLSLVPRLIQDLHQAQLGGTASGEIALFGNVLRRVSMALSPLGEVGTGEAGPAGPVAMFLAAEALRDSLRALPLAASLFRRVQTDFQESPFAPKALLAAAALDRAAADTLIQLLFSRYPTSPYALALTGSGGAAFVLAEDSLLAAARRRPPPEPPGVVPGHGVREDEDPNRPGRRRPVEP